MQSSSSIDGGFERAQAPSSSIRHRTRWKEGQDENDYDLARAEVVAINPDHL